MCVSVRELVCERAKCMRVFRCVNVCAHRHVRLHARVSVCAHIGACECECMCVCMSERFCFGT